MCASRQIRQVRQVRQIRQIRQIRRIARIAQIGQVGQIGRIGSAAVAGLLLVLLTANAAGAETCTWSGSAGDTKWSTATNWTGCSNRAPRNGDSLQFPEAPTAAQATSVNDIPNIAPSAIGIHSWLYQISGAGVRLAGSLTYDEILTSSANPSFLAPITLAAPLTITHAGASASRTLLLGDINLNGFALTFSYATVHTIEVDGTISGNGSIATQNQGQLVLAKANTYTGPTTLSASSQVRLLDVQGLGATGPGNETIVADGTVLFPTASPITVDESFTFTGTAGTLRAGNATFTGAMTFTASELFLALETTNATQVYTGPLVGDSLYIDNNVTFTNPANSWNTVLINSGHVIVGAPGAWPARAEVTVFGTLDLNGFDLATGPIGGCGTVALGTATLTVTTNLPSNPRVLGPVTGTGSIVKQGDGPFTLSAGGTCIGVPPSTFAGNVTVNAGRLVLISSAQPTGLTAVTGPIVVNGGSLEQTADELIGDTSTVTIKSGASWLSNNHSETIGSLTGDGSVSLGAGTLTIGGNASSTFGGVISSGTVGVMSTSLLKKGTGSLTLTGQNTYTGRTVIDGGTLTINGSIPGVVNVDAGTLGGIGTVGGISPINLAATSTGTVGPGSSPGILHSSSLVRLVPGLTFDVELNGPTAGSGYDQLDVNGDVILSTPTLHVTRRFGPPMGTTFMIIKVASGHAMTGSFKDLPEGATLDLDGQHFSITYTGGDGNDVVLTALEHPPAVTYYLSEGATGSFFDEDVLIANPNATAAPVTLTFSKEDGSQVTTTQTIPAQAHATVHVDKIAGLEATAASTQVRSEQGLPLVVERSMFWDASYYAGHTGSAVEQPATDWFFAEGSQGFFNTFVLVINPNATPTDVTFTFLRESDAPVTKTVTVGANTRLTLDAGTVPEIVNRSFGITVHATQPIMAERSMYFGTTPTRLWSGGTESAGVTALSTHWFMAEGATGGFFDTFILLSNPNNADAHVTLQYLLDTGDTISVPKIVPANARLTTNIETEADVRLHNAAVSTVVTSDQPIIAERSMYWPGAAVPWGEGHNSFGVVDAGLHWGLAEGRTGGPLNFHTYILLANPQATAANVTVNFLRETGAPVVKTFTVPPTSRFNIDTGTITELQNESFGADIQVTNGVPIIVERSMYWDSNGFSFSGGTNATGSRLP